MRTVTKGTVRPLLPVATWQLPLFVMSLFHVREWWGVTPGSSEEFGGECLAVGNLDNAPDGALKLATGSFSGLLRLYSPREAGFKVEDVRRTG